MIDEMSRIPALPPDARPHIAVLIETSTSFGRRLIDGVARYLREVGPWSVYLEQRSIYDPAPRWLKTWRGDGLIVKAAHPQLAEVVRSLGIPTVDLNEQITGLGLPYVYNDNEAIGRLAAEHLVERGFVSLAFVGHPGIHWSDRRGAGFTAAVGEAGRAVTVFQPTRKTQQRYQHDSWEAELNRLSVWLDALPKPVGVMAANDFLGVQVLDACRRAGVPVPEQAAVIGVDNDDIVDAIAYPPLSSVEPDGVGMGYLAATLLHRLMRGETLDEPEQLVAPRGLIVRQSTDVVAISDLFVAQALRIIRERACNGLGVDQVADALRVSRSVLQRRFRASLGRSVHDEIMRVKLNRARQMIRGTDLPLRTIAERSGFKHAEYLCTVFKRETGMTVTAYRAGEEKFG